MGIDILSPRQPWTQITHWQCEKKSKCKARLHTKEDQIIKRTNEHLHGPDNTKVRCSKRRLEKRKAVTQETSQHIIGKSIMEFSKGIAAKLPKLNSLKRTIHNIYVIFFVTYFLGRILTLSQYSYPIT